MSILDRLTKKTAAVASVKEEKTELEQATVREATAPWQKTTAVLRVLKRPHVSEKAAHLTEKGTYVFDVAPPAEKIAIKKAVETLYKVKVISVRTLRHAGKPVRRGRRASARIAWKKAVVTLAPGQKIEVYEGV